MLQVNSNKDQLISGVNSPIKNKDYLLQCQWYRHDMLTATKDQLTSGVNSPIKSKDYLLQCQSYRHDMCD